MRSKVPMKSSVLLAASLLTLSTFVLGHGCDGSREGDRCNPDLSHNDCHAGLTCQQPATCVESYCCPDPAKSSANPFCNGLACPAVDAGVSDAAPE
jgi:hypothetical protein